MVWTVHTIDENDVHVKILGIFPDSESAIVYICQIVNDEIRDDEDGYQDWLAEHQPNVEEEDVEEVLDESSAPSEQLEDTPSNKQAYINHIQAIFEALVRQWKTAIDTPLPKKRSFGKKKGVPMTQADEEKSRAVRKHNREVEELEKRQSGINWGCFTYVLTDNVPMFLAKE